MNKKKISAIFMCLIMTVVIPVVLVHGQDYTGVSTSVRSSTEETLISSQMTEITLMTTIPMMTTRTRGNQ